MLANPLDRSLVSIDWDRRCLRLVHARIGRGQVRVLRAAAVPVPAGVVDGDPEVLGDFLRQTLAREKIRARRAVVSVPRDQAVLNTLSLPEASRDELAAMVHFQVIKELPFPADEAVIDFAATGSPDSPRPPEPKAQAGDVLVAAVRNEVFDFYRRVCQRAELRLERIGLRPYENLVAVTEGMAAARTGLSLFVDVGPSLTEIDVIQAGRLAFSRAASVTVPEQPAPTGQDEQPEDVRGVVGDVLVEVTRSIAAYRATDPGARFDRIIVAGSCGIEAELAQAANRQIGAPAELYRPDAGLGLRDADAPHATSFSAAIGLALSHGSDALLHFDFLHPKQPEAARKERLRRIPVAAGVAVLFLATAVAGYMQYVQPKRAKLKELQSQLAKQKKWASQFNQLQAEYEAARKWADAEVIWLDELRRLADVFPPHQQAYMASLKLDGDGRIGIDLRAQRENVPATIREKLWKFRVGDEDRPHFLAQTPRVQQSNDKQYGFKADLKVGLAELVEQEAKTSKKTGRRKSGK